MAGFVKGSRGTIAAGDTTITFEPARPASFGIENRGSRDVTATASPGSVVFDVPAGDARTFNGGAFDSVVLSDGGIGDTPYSLYYGEQPDVMRAVEGAGVSGSISSVEIASSAVTTAKIADNAVTAAKLGADSIALAALGTISDEGGGALVAYVSQIAGGADDTNTPIELDDGFEVLLWGARLAADGTAGSTITLSDGANTIGTVDSSAGSNAHTFVFGTVDDAHAGLTDAESLDLSFASTAGNNHPAAVVVIVGRKPGA